MKFDLFLIGYFLLLALAFCLGWLIRDAAHRQERADWYSSNRHVGKAEVIEDENGIKVIGKFDEGFPRKRQS